MSAFIEIGYRPYAGPRHTGRPTWLLIAEATLAQIWRLRFLRVLVFLSWAPLLYFSLIFFAIGQVTQVAKDPLAAPPMLAAALLGVLGPQGFQAIGEGSPEIRLALWSALFFFLSTSSQVLAALLVPALVGPGLVADDVQSGSLALYFSRPIGRWQYLGGKLLAVMALIASVSLVPMLVLYTLSIFFSPSIDLVRDTYPVALRILAAGVVLVVPSSCLVLWLSSLSARRGTIAFLWIAFILGSLVINQVLSAGLRRAMGADMKSDPTVLFSYSGNLRRVLSGVFNAAEHVRALAEFQPALLQVVRRLEAAGDWRLSLVILAVLAVAALTMVASFVKRRMA